MDPSTSENNTLTNSKTNSKTNSMFFLCKENDEKCKENIKKINNIKLQTPSFKYTNNIIKKNN